MRTAYQTDLSDAEWALIEPYLPAPKAPGRPRVHPLREILDAVFYVVRGGCTWRLLPHDFPPWKTVYHYFRAWRIDGTFIAAKKGDSAWERPSEVKAQSSWRWQTALVSLSPCMRRVLLRMRSPLLKKL